MLNLGLPLALSVLQAGAESLGAEDVTLWLSEVLKQAVGPLAHRTDVQPESVCEGKHATCCLWMTRLTIKLYTGSNSHIGTS